MKTNEETAVSCNREYSSKRMTMHSHEHRTIVFCLRGFTLVELIVIVAILGVLMIMALPSYSYIVQKVKVSRCMAEIRTIEKDVNAYQIDKGSLPDSLADIGRGDLRDPWGNAYRYHRVPTYLDIVGIQIISIDFDLYSMGSDEASAESLDQADCQDDIVRAGEGGYVGLGENWF